MGNHEIWDLNEEKARELAYIVEKYRTICIKHNIIFLHNELAFFYDEMTENGDIIPFFDKKIISNNELLSIEPCKLLEYSKRAKLIVYGGLGFSGRCKTKNSRGRIYNAEFGLYLDIITTLKEDIEESKKCENGYLKVLDALKESQVIILTHTPFANWTISKYSPHYIYVNGHTHQDFLETTKEKKIFADNQVGYSSDDYALKYFYIDGSYDAFKEYQDGIYKITYEQYIDFNIGKNIKAKINKKVSEKQIYLIKKCDFYMFVYYNSDDQLMLLDGGRSRQLQYNIDYYWKNIDVYGCFLKSTMDKYICALNSASAHVKQIGGNGKIHGCIIDIDYWNHIYINPYDGSIIPYYALNKKEKYVYDNLNALLAEKRPDLLVRGKRSESEKREALMQIYSESKNRKKAVLVTDKDMYKESDIIRNIQYLLFQNVIRNWNDKIMLKYMNPKEAIEELSKKEF